MRLPRTYPLPPPELVFLIHWRYDLQMYLDTGSQAFLDIDHALETVSQDTSQYNRVLDFGCGCGRVLRHFPNISRLRGCDYNPAMIEWCRHAFPSARFYANGLGLHFENASFDFIYALSVFTHFNQAQERFWLHEFHRLLAPGGILLLTVIGETCLKDVPALRRVVVHPKERESIRDRYAGTNLCAAYVPYTYFKDLVECLNWRVIGFLPGGAKGTGNQDIYLLQLA